MKSGILYSSNGEIKHSISSIIFSWPIWRGWEWCNYWLPIDDASFEWLLDKRINEFWIEGISLEIHRKKAQDRRGQGNPINDDFPLKRLNVQILFSETLLQPTQSLEPVCFFFAEHQDDHLPFSMPCVWSLLQQRSMNGECIENSIKAELIAWWCDQTNTCIR